MSWRGFCAYRGNDSGFSNGSSLAVGTIKKNLMVGRCDTPMKLNELDIFDIIGLIGLDAVFPSCVKLVVAKISGIITRTLKKGGKKMAKAKFQDTLKSGLTGVATVGKKIVDTAGDGAAAAISKGKEQLDKANQKKGEALSSQQMVDILDVCYDKALQGIPKVSKSVDELAEDYSSKYPTAEKAAKALAANQLVKCTTSGFLTGLGGIITLPVAVPANVSSVLYVQLRMIAAVAKLGGYEPNTD